MGGYKTLRRDEDLKRELSEILREIKDPRIPEFVSVVRVETAVDLSSCKVFLSFFDNKIPQKEIRHGLKSAEGFIKRELGRRTTLRRIPELQFVMDDSLEHASKIYRTLEDLKRKETL